MNYLAHLHIAEQAQSSFLGNLAADFIRGNPDKTLPTSVANGVRLHRFVDATVDSEPEIMDCYALFPKGLRRIAPIALDIYWDHLLINEWKNFHSLGVDEFLTHVQDQIALEESQCDDLPARYLQVSRLLWQQQWIMSYRSWRGFNEILYRMSQRSIAIKALPNCAPIIDVHSSTLHHVFHNFYPRLLNAAQQRKLC